MQKCLRFFFFCRNPFWWIKDQHSVKSVGKAWSCLIWAPTITSGKMQYVDVNAVYDLLYASIFTCIYRWPIDTLLLRNYNLFHFNIQTKRSRRIRSANRYYPRIWPIFIACEWYLVYSIIARLLQWHLVYSIIAGLLHAVTLGLQYNCRITASGDSWFTVYIIAWFSPAAPCCTPAGPRWLGRPTEAGGPAGRRPRARAPPAAAGPVPRPGIAHRRRSHSPPTWKRSTTKSRESSYVRRILKQLSSL